MTDTLPEVAASDADPETRSLYGQIMTLTGVGSPALIYRHFAVFPGFLNWVWKIIGPELENGFLVREAPDLAREVERIRLPKMTTSDLADCGLSEPDIELLGAMFATYNRMNPVNLALITAVRNILADEISESSDAPLLPPADPAQPATTMTLPAPVNLKDMDQDLRSTILDISSAIPSTNGVVIPTLYRHIAIWPELMRRVAPGIASAIQGGDVSKRMIDTVEAIAPLTAQVIGRAGSNGMDKPPIADPTKMVVTLDSFLVTIPQLIVLGIGLDDAIET